MAERQKVSENRKARHFYEIEERLEAGLVLSGAEVKSLRAGRVSLDQSHIQPENGELYLLNAFIAPYDAATHISYNPRRKRKLLLHRRQIASYIGILQKSGMTMVPTLLYFNEEGRAKVEVALARGRKKVDKRREEKDRDWQRRKERLMRRRP